MFDDLKVLVVGDIIVDHYIYGSVNRISPEAPVPVLDVEKEEYRLGGAGNTFLNVKGLGAKVKCYGWLGLDYDPNWFKCFEIEDVGHKHTTYNLKQTIIKTRLVSSQQLIRYDVIPRIVEKDTAPPNKLINQKTDVYILSDYNKGVIHQKCLDLFKNKNTFLGLVS